MLQKYERQQPHFMRSLPFEECENTKSSSALILSLIIILFIGLIGILFYDTSRTTPQERLTVDRQGATSSAVPFQKIPVGRAPCHDCFVRVRLALHHD